MDERPPIKIDVVGTVASTAWTVAVTLSWIYVIFGVLIPSFWKGNPNTGFSDPTPLHGFKAPVWSRPSRISLAWNTLISGMILAFFVAFLCDASTLAFWSVLVGWILIRFAWAASQLHYLSLRYRANPSSLRLVVDCTVKPGSRYAIDIRRNRFGGDEWAKSPMRNAPEEGETIFIVGGRSATCPQIVKEAMARDFEQANRDAKALGFRDLFDFAAYRTYFCRMVSDEAMASDRQAHISKWIEHFDGCGFGEEDLKRWFGYLNSVKPTWELKPYVPPIETAVDPYDLDGEVSDETLDRLADTGEQFTAGEKLVKCPPNQTP